MKGKNKTPYSQLTSIKYYKVGECTSRSRKRSDAKVGLYKYRVGKGLMPLHFVNKKKKHFQGKFQSYTPAARPYSDTRAKFHYI
jgi:hypothetical protein